MRTELHDAAARGDVVKIRELVSKGLNINIDDGGYLRSTAVHIAASHGHVQLIRCLKKFGVNVNTTDKYGYTPMHNAVLYGAVDAISCLEELGSDLFVKTKYGQTPLDVANGEEDVMDIKETKKLLLTLMAKQEAKNKQQQTSSTLKTPETIQSELQQELSLVPKKLIENVQAEIKETKEKYDQIISE